MTAPFVASVRARPDTLTIGADGSRSWTIRVQSLEMWDMVRIQLPPSTSVRTVKDLAIGVLMPRTEDPDQLVIKLNGFEVLDEDATVADAGAIDGSTLLLTHRRRRPVR